MEGGSAGGSSISGMGGWKGQRWVCRVQQGGSGGWHSGVAVVQGVGTSQAAEAQVGVAVIW